MLEPTVPTADLATGCILNLALSAVNRFGKTAAQVCGSKQPSCLSFLSLLSSSTREDLIFTVAWPRSTSKSTMIPQKPSLRRTISSLRRPPLPTTGGVRRRERSAFNQSPLWHGLPSRQSTLPSRNRRPGRRGRGGGIPFTLLWFPGGFSFLSFRQRGWGVTVGGSAPVTELARAFLSVLAWYFFLYLLGSAPVNSNET